MSLHLVSDEALALRKSNLEAVLARKGHSPANYTGQLDAINAELERRVEDGSPDIDDSVTVETQS